MKVFPGEHWPCWTRGKQKRKKISYLHGRIEDKAWWNNQYLHNIPWVLRLVSGKHKVVQMLEEESLTSVSIKYSNYSRRKRAACVSSFTLWNNYCSKYLIHERKLFAIQIELTHGHWNITLLVTFCRRVPGKKNYNLTSDDGINSPLNF